MPPPIALPTDQERAAALDAALALHGLTLDPAWRSEVLFHMTIIAEAAQLLLDFPLEDALESAPIYQP